MITVRHGLSAAPPTSCATAFSSRPATDRNLGRLAVALLRLALLACLLAPVAAASAKPPTFASLAVAVSGTTASTTGPARAAPADRISPTVTAITPAAGPNDIDTPVVISGTDFAAVMSETVVLTSPSVTLGSTALTNVTFISDTTLTATVPWGLNPGS